MPLSRDPGALLSRSYELPSGPRVRLRLARPTDLPGIRTLLAERGLPATEIGLERLVRYEPRRRAVICATAPLDGTEAAAGVGAVVLEPHAAPDILGVDRHVTDRLQPH